MRRPVLVVLAMTLATLGLGAGSAGAAPHFQTPPSVQVGYTDSATPHSAYDVADQDVPLGARRDDRGRKHVSRVYATFDLTAFAATNVLGGTLAIEETGAADCTKRAIEVWQTKSVTRTPTWRHAPAEVRKLDEIRTSTYCPAPLSFDVSAALAAKQDSVTFEIRVPRDVERDPTYGRTLRWYTGVSLTVRYNSAPSILSQYQYNSGFPCDTTAPYRRIGSFPGMLQALATDPDADDNNRLTYEFAVWPQDDPAARLTLTDDFGMVTTAADVQVPNDYLADGGTYSWQVRVADGVDTSAWSQTCSFVIDKTNPSAPTVTSAAPGEFTFNGNGDPDTAGFEYTWGEFSVPGCEYHEYVILVCREPFSGATMVRADAPGGTVTVNLTPPHLGTNVLRVRALDATGRLSPSVRFEIEP
jgi:hypothetical protein